MVLMITLATSVVQSVNYIDCKSFGRQTGRDVVYDWNCYAWDDAGKMVP